MLSNAVHSQGTKTAEHENPAAQTNDSSYFGFASKAALERFVNSQFLEKLRATKANRIFLGVSQLAITETVGNTIGVRIVPKRETQTQGRLTTEQTEILWERLSRVICNPLSELLSKLNLGSQSMSSSLAVGKDPSYQQNFKELAQIALLEQKFNLEGVRFYQVSIGDQVRTIAEISARPCAYPRGDIEAVRKILQDRFFCEVRFDPQVYARKAVQITASEDQRAGRIVSLERLRDAWKIPTRKPPRIISDIRKLALNDPSRGLKRYDLRDQPFIAVDDPAARCREDAIYCCTRGEYHYFITIFPDRSYVDRSFSLNKETPSIAVGWLVAPDGRQGKQHTGIAWGKVDHFLSFSDLLPEDKLVLPEDVRLNISAMYNGVANFRNWRAAQEQELEITKEAASQVLIQEVMIMAYTAAAREFMGTNLPLIVKQTEPVSADSELFSILNLLCPGLELHHLNNSRTPWRLVYQLRSLLEKGMVKPARIGMCQTAIGLLSDLTSTSSYNVMTVEQAFQRGYVPRFKGRGIAGLCNQKQLSHLLQSRATPAKARDSHLPEFLSYQALAQECERLNSSSVEQSVI
ncbi:MAG: hypothetical protein R3A13_03325 [Bdellovibrionota bacterium]